MEEEMKPDESKLSAAMGCRKSDRRRTQKRAYSPERPTKRKYKRHKESHVFHRESVAVRAFDKLADGTPFCCDLCKSPYVCKTTRQRTHTKRSRHQPAPRVKTDPSTGEKLTLCNACGLAFDRPVKVKSEASNLPTSEEKEKYAEEARQFAYSLVEVLHDPDAERLCCPEFKKRPCGCIQKYIIGEGNAEESKQRAERLLQLLKQAKKLSTQKVYNMEEFLRSDSKKRNQIGLGNGQKHSKEFGDFVIQLRKILRDDYKLCERGCQRILLYSNNFLHKRLKTEDHNCRIEQIRSKTAPGRVKEIASLHREKCCANHCCLIALSHTNLLETWRERSASGQAETRRVLAEMLTPSGGLRSNCYKFIQWVTAAGYSTIASVDKQMKITGGNREPPEHGLRKYHREMQKLQAHREAEQSAEYKRREFGDEGIGALHRDVPPVEQQSHHTLPASMPQETTVLSATESVVVEQVNVLPGEEVAHLVVDNGTTGHLVEISCADTSQPMYVPYVQELVVNQEYSRLQEIKSHSQPVERHHLPPRNTTCDPAKFQTVTRLLNTKQPQAQVSPVREESESALQIDLSPPSPSPEKSEHIYNERLTAQKEDMHNSRMESVGKPDNLEQVSRRIFEGIPEKDIVPGVEEAGLGRNKDDAPKVNNLVGHMPVPIGEPSPEKVPGTAQPEVEKERTESPRSDTRAELEAQRKQIAMLQKQVAEQQVQLQQQQQLLHTQLLSNIILTQSKQTTPSIQLPGLPAGLTPTLPQLPNLLSGLPISALPVAAEVPQTNAPPVQVKSMGAQGSSKTMDNEKYSEKSKTSNSTTVESATRTPTGSTLPSNVAGIKATAQPSVSLAAGLTLPSYLPNIQTVVAPTNTRQLTQVESQSNAVSGLQGTNVAELLSQPLTAAQHEVLRELLPSQKQVTGQPKRQEPVNPPPPYEVAASTSRQGSVERVTPERHTADSSSETAISPRIPATSITNSATTSQSTRVVPETRHPAARRGRKPKCKPFKSPPKVTDSPMGTPFVPPSAQTLMLEAHSGSNATAQEQTVNLPVDKAPHVLQQLLQISQAVGDGQVTTLTLSQDQAQEIIEQLNKCAGTDTIPSTVNISGKP